MVFNLGAAITDRQARRQWPRLDPNIYRLTSAPDPNYNCVGHAMKYKVWWEPSGRPEHYWPRRVPLEDTMDAYIEAFRTRHFVLCETDEAEEGYEKIALYADEIGRFTHVAVQLPGGEWSSKLGKARDIATPLLDDLVGNYYGEPVRFMRRPRRVRQEASRRRR